jgi:hypothetical protein
MRGWLGIAGVSLAATIVAGIGVTASAESPPPVPARMTISCPSFGHTNPPDASGWTTKYFGYPNATVTAQISGGNFVCHDVMNPAVPLPPIVAQSSHAYPDKSFVCTPSGPGAPPAFSCVGGPTGHALTIAFACPATAVSDFLDDPAWSTRHNSGAAIVAVTNDTPPILNCMFLTATSSITSSGSEVATATRAIGTLQGCQVGPDGKSFTCLLPRVP